MASFITSAAGTLGRFGKRLAMQAVISSIVMTGIGLVSRDDFALPRQVLTAAGLSLPGGLLAASAPEAPPPAFLTAARPPAGGTMAADKAERLAFADDLVVPTPVPAPARLASAAGGGAKVGTVPAPSDRPAAGRRGGNGEDRGWRDEAAPEGVLLFTQCAPACESHDPMLLAAAGPGDGAAPASALAAAAWAPPPPPPPPPAKETLLESATALPGRAIGGAAAGLGQLIVWGQ